MLPPLRSDRHGNVADVGNTIFLYSGYAADKRRQKLRGLIQIELEQLALRIGRHGPGFSELVDQRRIVRHRHAHELVADGNARHVNGRPAVEGKRDRKGLSA
jgi:hypothetical protein